MSPSTTGRRSRCDEIIALIDRCLTDYEWGPEPRPASVVGRDALQDLEALASA
jgi:hypothetical protein